MARYGSREIHDQCEGGGGMPVRANETLYQLNKTELTMQEVWHIVGV